MKRIKASTFAAAMVEAERCLIDNGHRLTQPRRLVLAILLSTESALTRDDVCAALERANRRVDRVTAYRVLDWLVEHELAHRIANDTRAWQFNASKEFDNDHAHFACKTCDRVFCLDDPEPVVVTPVPAGFHADESEVLIRGNCADCAT